MEQPLWTPPGPIDEILELAAIMHIRNVVHATGAIFDGTSPQIKTEGRQAVDALVAKLDSELKKGVAEFVAKRRSMAA